MEDGLDRDQFTAEVVKKRGATLARPLATPNVLMPLEGAKGLDAGTVVLVEQHGEQGAKVLKTLAKAQTARSKMYHLLAEYDLEVAFPREVREETQGWLDNPGFDEPGLKDMTGQPFVTIDNADSRDLDQALYIERGPDDKGYVLHYALSDAAYYVRPGSALFDEARRRGSSYYLPGIMAPMLPEALSAGLVSLNPDELRRALIFSIHLDPLCHVQKTEIFQGLIRSRGKLTYDGVQILHDALCHSPLTERPFTESLMLMREIGERRIALSEARDVIQFNRVAVGLSYTDADGTALKATVDARNDVERWNEQISLLCNMEGARFLSGGGEHVQPIYRVHPFPEAEDLDKLSGRLREIIDARALDHDVWGWDYNASGQHTSLAQYIEKLPSEGLDERVRQAIERQAMFTISPSSFTDERGPHFGIGAPEYSRFSSPMREIVGIFTHKEALEKLRGEGGDNAVDEALRSRVIAAGNGSKKLQRNLSKAAYKIAMDQLFADDLALPMSRRPRRPGTILGVRSSRLYVQLDDPPLEIKVYAHHLRDEDGQDPTVSSDRTGMTRAGGQSLLIGDEIRVVVAGKDKKDRWRFVPA